MMKLYPSRMRLLVAVMAIFACALTPAAFAAAKSYTVTFSTGTTATVAAGEDLVFAITCQPPTDIVTITASAGTLTTEKATPGGPSTPQGTINGLWTLSDIAGDVTITLDLNTQEGADLPVIVTGREEAEAALAGSGMGGGPGGAPGEGGAPPAGGPGGAPPAGAQGGPPQGGAPGAAPPAGAPS